MSSNKKIIAFISSLQIGGAELTFSEVVSSLTKSGHEVHVITLADTVGDSISIDCKSIHSLSLSSKGASVLKKCQNLFHLVWNIRQSIKKKNPDVVLSFMTQTNLIVLFASLFLPYKKRCKKIVATRIHPDFSPTLTAQYFGGFFRFLRNILYRTASAITVQSSSMIETLPSYLRSKIKVIPNHVRHFDLSITEKAGESIEKKYILSVGRLVEQKNHRLLLNAFSQFTVKYPEWHLAIVGDGELEEELKHYAAEIDLNERVSFFGKTRRVEEWFQKASIFVLTSKYEGFPNVLVEAMSFGLPCVATDSPGAVRDILRSHENGILVPLDNSDMLSEAIEELILNKEKREALGTAARESLGAFKRDSVMQNWIDLVKGL